VGQVVVDTSVVIALRDRHDAHHAVADQVLTRARSRQSQLVLPASAYAESLVHPLAAGIADDKASDELIRLFRIEPLTREIAFGAAKLRATSRLRLPDALVLATGIALDAERILTCDRSWKDTDRRVQVLS
jgi:predicted nucleic acid-binding protein